MADLIAQGGEAQQRWRRTLRVGEHFTLGRDAGTWSVPWDGRISRRHAELCWQGGKLEVHRLPDARNPIFVAGEEAQQFELAPGGHFVIGNTTFSLVSEGARLGLLRAGAGGRVPRLGRLRGRPLHGTRHAQPVHRRCIGRG
jgi:adenylate cyclase